MGLFKYKAKKKKKGFLRKAVGFVGGQANQEIKSYFKKKIRSRVRTGLNKIDASLSRKTIMQDLDEDYKKIKRRNIYA